MKISAALIVKNEERCLSRCLETVKGSVDEIVIVDTGSTDSTKEIAGQYTDKLYDYEWRNDFASARQYSFEKTTGDWVFWLDADDLLRNAAGIRPLVERAGADVAGFYWRYITARDQWGNPTCQFWRERCVRNDDNFCWKGRIHEVMVPQRQCRLIKAEEIFVEHAPDVSRVPEKRRRNLTILEEERRSETDCSPRTLFYLASEHHNAGNLRKALRLYKEYLRKGTWDDERYFAQTRIAALYRSLEQYDDAITADMLSLRICPHWPDAYFGLAETYYYLGDWHKVVHWTEVGRAMPEPETTHIVSPMRYRFDWIIYYTNALYRIGEVSESLKWTRHALELCPGAEWHRENFFLFTHKMREEEAELTDRGLAA
jgi:glycosyltransferase involved in cell wall biosynthesis